MTATTSLLLVAVGLLAALDWFAVASDNPQLERVAKPAVMLALLGITLLSDVRGWPLLWLCLGLLAGMLGDVLLLPTVDRFIPGLAAFLLGHVAYALLALWFGMSTGRLVVGLVLASAAVVTVGTRITDAVQGTAMFAPVLAYVVVIGTSTAFLVGTGIWLMAAGGVLFAVSDSLLGWGRFLADTPGGRVVVHATYHIGQTLIVAGAVSAI